MIKAGYEFKGVFCIKYRIIGLNWFLHELIFNLIKQIRKLRHLDTITCRDPNNLQQSTFINMSINRQI